ncbi:MAG: SagB/ThcOx family dehydrogenase [Deltaproteobacteria bacterium]
MRFLAVALFVFGFPLFGGGSRASAADPDEITFPAVRTESGRSLMHALADRRSTRAFSPKELASEVLGDLLWAADGVNRRDSGRRTAPSARNMQEIEIYAATARGLYLYDPAGHRLVRVLAEDIRPAVSREGFAQNAPVTLIYVADHRKMTGTTVDEKEFYGATDAAFISQNVYLYCASEGLATVVLGSFNRLDLTRAMRLDAAETVVLAQPVGYAQ